MPSWDDVLKTLDNKPSPLDEIRSNYIDKLAKLRNRNVICYYSGWLQKPQGDSSLGIVDDDMNGFMNAIHGLDREKGLDIVLHTPGGDLAATESIVNYLKDCFKKDICAIIPQLAMSAGTMIACSCKTIFMGRQSSLGPTDPQLGGVAAEAVIEEFKQAVDEISTNPASTDLWSLIIGKYHPTFLGDCEKAIKASQAIVSAWLLSNMFSQEKDATKKVEKIVQGLCTHDGSAMHNRHFSYNYLQDIGLKIELLEDNDELQDTVLTIHHAYMNTFARSNAIKIVENNLGKKLITSLTSR